MIVRGDAEGCAVLGTLLSRAATGAGTAAGSLATARGATPSWTGEAGDAWRATADHQRAAADDLAAALAAAGAALSRFAVDLAEAQLLAAAAASTAAAWGLPLSASGSVPRVDVPYGPFTSPEAAAEATAAQQRADARSSVLSLVQQAQEAERLAHQRLTTALRGLDPAAARETRGTADPTYVSRLRPTWSTYVNAAHDLLLAPGRIADGHTVLSQARHAFGREVERAARTAPAAFRADLRALAKDEIRAAVAARSTAARYGAVDDVARRVPWLTALGGRVPQSVPVLRGVPVVGLVGFGLGTADDLAQGRSVPHAVTKNAASTVAGSVAAAGATALTASALGVTAVAAAPVLVGIAVGVAVGVGVGAAVDEWGDDVARGVGSAAGGAKDAVSKAWDSVFG